MFLQDDKDRVLAVENHTQNIIVEAGAGTGKTTLLVKRMLFTVLVRKVKISRLVALTFTKKAAASLKEKLEEELHIAYKILFSSPFVLTAGEEDFISMSAKYSKTQQEEFKKFRYLFLRAELNVNDMLVLIKSALEEIPLCQIGTIHSFCNFLLKKYAVEAGLNTNMEISEAGFTNIIFDKCWDTFLEEELTLTNPKKEIWLDLLKEISLSELRAFAFSLCNPKFADYNPKDNYPALKSIASKYIKEANCLIKNYPKTRGFMIPLLKECTESLANSIGFYDNCDNNYQEIKFHNTPTTIPANWEIKDFNLALQIIDFAKSNIPQKQILFNQAYSLLKPFALKVEKEILNQNYLTFDEIIFKTHYLLLKDKAVRQELKLSYDSIFIDEFQDTDPIQGEIMLFLAEDQHTFANRWQDLKLERGKLFIVGDPKQSIYHFRGADISAYQEFCSLLKSQGAQEYVLHNNFRSSEHIINYVNTFGRAQIKFKENSQAEYKEIYPSKKFNNSRMELYLHSSEGEKLSAKDKRQNYAVCIAKWIADNVKKTNKSDGTPLEYKDIALLLPTFTDLNIFLNALKENNIPYNVEDDRNFYSAQEILDLINILKVLKDPQNKIALLGVLRSPVCVISDEVILSLSLRNKLNIYAEVTDLKVRNIYKKLRFLRDKVAHLNPLELINEILETLNFSYTQTLASLNEQSLANISKFKQVAAKLFDNGFYTLEQLLDNFETYQKERNKESSAILAEGNFNVIKILSIHKSKGLEYPVVILTDLSKEFGQGDVRTKEESVNFYSRSKNLKGISLGIIQDGIIPVLKAEQETQILEETRRLLYVAMTRAKEALIMVDALEAENNTFLQMLCSSGCWPDKEKREENLLSAKVFYRNFVMPDILPNIQSKIEQGPFSFDFNAWHAEFSKRTAEYKEYLNSAERLTGNNQTLFPSPDVEHAIKVGSLCHKILQNIFNNTDVAQGILMEESFKEALEIVNNFCKTPAYEDLKNMQFLASEFPISTIENGLVKNGIIDAVFRTKQGNIKIIDFKSDKIKEVNAKTIEPAYLEQLAFYKNALSRIFKGKIESALVYLRPAKIYDIEE